MTVAELKDILNDFDDDTKVFINNTSGNIRDIYGSVEFGSDEKFLLIVA